MKGRKGRIGDRQGSGFSLIKCLQTGLPIFLHFIRFPAFGFTAMLALLGAATITPKLPGRETAGLVALALCFHIYSYVLNDVIDLPLDRSQPLRAKDPLVRGLIDRRLALLFALLQIPIALLIALGLGARGWPLAVLVIGFVFMAVYNLWGKRTAVPLATDLAQGIAWGTLVFFGATIAGGNLLASTSVTVVIFTFVLIYIVLVNGIHGSVRDVANDLGAGRRSMAILLGARPHPKKGLIIPTRLVVYALSLQAALIVLLFWPIVRNDFGYRPLFLSLTLGAMVLLTVVCLRHLKVILKPDSRHSQRVESIKRYLFFSLSALVVLFALYLHPGYLLVLLIMTLVPLLPTEWGAKLFRVNQTQ